MRAQCQPWEKLRIAVSMMNQDIVRSVVIAGFCKTTCAILGDLDEGYSIYILFIIQISII